MRTYGLKAIGLSLMAAIGLMAFTATAQAAEELTLVSKHLAILLNSGTFLKTGTKTAASGVQIGTMGIKIPGKNGEIKCEKGTLSEGSVENEADTKKNPEGKELTSASESGLSAMGQTKIQFSKCKVVEESSGKELVACTAEFNKNNPEPFMKALILAFLHFHKSTIAGEVLEHHIYIVRLTPLGAVTFPATFTTLKFGGTCSLPEKVEVKGSFSGEIPKTDAVKQTVTFDGATAAGKAVSKDAETKLSFGANEAFFKGTLEIELEGSPSWGVM